MLSLPLYLQSIHSKEFDRNLHTAGSYSLLSECSLGKNSMFSLLFLTVNVHHKQPQQVTISVHFFLPFTCYGIIFFYLK